MKRVIRVTLVLLLCTILTMASCKKAADPAGENTQLLPSEPVLQNETELASDTVHWSDIDLDSNPADTTAAQTESTESSIEVTELPEPDTTVPQSYETETEPAPTEAEKVTVPQTTEPKPTAPAPTEPKPTESPHVHSWGAWQQTTAPTCGAEGSETRSCSGCAQAETQPVAATGNHSWSETAAPTCTAAGSKTCTICGMTESMAALGHAWVHHDEEGHWRAVLTCRCGAVFYSYDEWSAHMDSYLDTAEEGNHTGFSQYGEWIVDHSAYDICSLCGMTR